MLVGYSLNVYICTQQYIVTMNNKLPIIVNLWMTFISLYFSTYRKP